MPPYRHPTCGSPCSHPEPSGQGLPSVGCTQGPEGSQVPSPRPAPREESCRAPGGTSAPPPLPSWGTLSHLAPFDLIFGGPLRSRPGCSPLSRRHPVSWAHGPLYRSPRPGSASGLRSSCRCGGTSPASPGAVVAVAAPAPPWSRASLPTRRGARPVPEPVKLAP